MNNEVKFVIEGYDNSGPAFRSVNENLDKTTAKVKLMAKEQGLAGGEVDKLGGKLGGLKGALRDVENVVDSKSRSGKGGFLSNLIGNVGDLPEKLLGGNFSQALDKQLGQGLEMSLSNPYVLGAAAAAAPALGAAVGGAILAGIGLAGIGAGIAGQIHNPKVTQALNGLETDAANIFSAATSSFEKPLRLAIHGIDEEVEKLGPGLSDMFEKLAPSLSKLSVGVSGFLDKLVPGLENAAESSTSIIGNLSNWLPRLGSEVGAIFTTISAHEKEAAEGMLMVERTLDILLTTVDIGIPIMAKLFDAAKFTTLGLGFLTASKDADTTSESVDQLNQQLADMNDTVDQGVTFFSDLISQLDSTSKTADSVAGALTDHLLNAMLGIDNATLSMHKSITGLNDSLEKNGKSFDENTKAGQNNMEALLGGYAAAQRLYDQQIQNGMAATDAAKAYDRNSSALRQQLREAGLTNKQIDNLTKAYNSVPDDVNTDIRANGLVNALNNIGSLLARLNGLDGSQYGFTVISKTVYETDYISHHEGEDQPGKHAFGGIASGVSLLNEQGPELVHLPTGSTVFTANQSAAMLASGQVGGAKDIKIEHTFVFPANTALGSMLLKMQRNGELPILSRAIVN